MNSSAGYLPSSDVLVGETIQTMTHQVWINRQYICSTDRDYLADMVSRAINHWRKTPDGEQWWSERKKADNGRGKPRVAAAVAQAEICCASSTGYLALVPCPKCGKRFNPYWSERLKRAAKVCASCAWRNLEAFLNELDPEEEAPDNGPNSPAPRS